MYPLKALPAALLALSTVAPMAHAAEAPPPQKAWGWVVSGSAEFGGDDIVTVFFTDGSSQDLEAGQGLGADVGAYWRPGGGGFSARATVGFKYVTTKANNTDLHLRRIPLQLIGSYHFDNGIRLGLGLAQHTGIRLDGDGMVDNLRFRNASGWVAEAGWKWLVVSYTKMDYEAEVGGTVSANNVGLRLIGEF